MNSHVKQHKTQHLITVDGVTILNFQCTDIYIFNRPFNINTISHLWLT